MVVRWIRTSQRLLAISAALVGGLLTSAQCMAQAAATAPAIGSSSAGLPVAASPGRRLAPEAFHVIPPGGEFGDTFEGPFDLPLVTPAAQLEWNGPMFANGSPNFAPSTQTLAGMSKDLVIRHEVWSMEFGFKPVRMIAVDLPNAQGEMQSKVVWYLLYYVRYKGGDLDPNLSKDQFGNEVVGQPVPGASKQARRFIPGFAMNCSALGKRYQSQFLPQALPLIAEKERVGKPIYDSIAIQKVPVQLSTARETHDVWGVATWTDIDPRTDFFSVEVRGLTNAQRTETIDGQLVSKQKTLVLNSSRPGDTINELADRIRYGIPALADAGQQQQILSKYGLKERLDYYWVYR